MQRPIFNIQIPTPYGSSARSKPFDLDERLLDYAARIVRLCNKLPRTR